MWAWEQYLYRIATTKQNKITLLVLVSERKQEEQQMMASHCVLGIKMQVKLNYMRFTEAWHLGSYFRYEQPSNLKL